MIAAKIERKIDTSAKYLALFVGGWLACSATYGTLDLHHKEWLLQKVQASDIPKLKTELKQANCDKRELRDVAAKAIAAAESPDLDAPDWNDLHGCPKVAPVPPRATARN